MKINEIRERFIEDSNILPTLLFLGAMFFLGRTLAGAVEDIQANSAQAWQENNIVEGEAAAGYQVLNSENWGLGFGAEGTQPTGNASASELAKYNAYYVGDSGEKKIYLTFDCGYE